METAYIAGFFDGEGGIGITRKLTHNSYQLRLSICNTNFEVIKLIHEITGGSLYFEKRVGDKQILQRQPIARLQIGGKLAEKLLIDCLPYLIVKKPQAELGIEFSQWWWTLPRNKKGVMGRFAFTQEMWNTAEQYYEKMRELNKRVYVPINVAKNT